MAEYDIYTQDGTIDIYNKPANKKKTGNWKAGYFLLVNQCCERLAYYGVSINLVNYLRNRFNQGNATAAKNVTTWSGTCYLTPLLGVCLADACLGRYWAIASFSIVYVIGMVFLTLSATATRLKTSCDANGCHQTSVQTAVCFIGLYLIALGTGSTRCVTYFSADQFDEMDREEKKSKSSFLIWLFSLNIVGLLVASSVLVWIQMNVDWGWGFGVPAAIMVISVIFFFGGSRCYRLKKPGGSPLTRICQVIVAASRKFSLQVPADESLLHETTKVESNIKGSCRLNHTNTLKCLDKAAVETQSDYINDFPNPWKLCTVTQVEELKCVIRLLPVWATLVALETVYSQISTTFVLQGNTMDQHIGPHFKIPSASLYIFELLSVIFWNPLKCIIVLCARNFTGHGHGLTKLQQIGLGLIISIFSMVIAGIVEFIRLDIVRKNSYYDLETIPMSIFWQVPQYFLLGGAECFTRVCQLEFFVGQSPDSMKLLCLCLSLTTTTMGNYMSSLLVTIVTKVTMSHGSLGWIPDNLNRGHLDYFYWLLSILSFLNFLVFLWISKRYRYKGSDLKISI